MIKSNKGIIHIKGYKDDILCEAASIVYHICKEYNIDIEDYMNYVMYTIKEFELSNLLNELDDNNTDADTELINLKDYINKLDGGNK